MKKRSLIIAILLIFVVILSSSSVFAENATDDVELQQDDDVADTVQADEEPALKAETVTAGSNSSAIQEKINGLSDGDTLEFEAGEYKNISIYVDKSITINGNGAVLTGYDNPSAANNPEKITSLGLTKLATLFIVNTNKVTLNGLTFVGGANSGANTASTLVYAYNVTNINITGNTFDGSCTGLYLDQCPDGTVYNNTIKNQASTGILNFGSARTMIKENHVINAANHGIDARYGTGVNVQIINNTVIGSKEGIYLMHSKGHTVTGNTIINCTISSITCYGSGNIRIYDNKLQYSRIGVLLACGYTNITIGENEYKLYRLPMPPIFTYYVAEAKSDYQSADGVMGTYTDLSRNGPSYSENCEIPEVSEKVIDYDKLLTPTGTIADVPDGATSAEIQAILDGLSDGDGIRFAENGKYYNISIYTTKNIKIIGNNATLYGLERVNMSDMPAAIRNIGVIYLAVIYSANNTNVSISDLNIVSRYHDHGLLVAGTPTPEYKTAGIYAVKSANIVIHNCKVDGASFGIMLHFLADFGRCSNAIVTNNYVSNQFTYGILNFGSINSYIANNNIVDAKWHGIDVRHGQGPNAVLYNNTISGSYEGIYLMHSHGHKVYNNTIKNCKVSSITVYGSVDGKVNNIYIFNNTLEGSRIAFLLGGGNQNVTIGENTYKLDAQKSGDKPGFGLYLVQSELAYDDPDKVAGVYNDQKEVVIEAPDITVDYETGEFNIILTDKEGNGIANITGTVTIDGQNYNIKTDDDGKASIPLKLTNGTYDAITKTTSNYYLRSGYKESTITVNPKADDSGNNNQSGNGTDNAASTTPAAPAQTSSSAQSTAATQKTVKITAKNKAFKAKSKKKKYTVTLKSGNKALKKVKVTLKVKGKTYKATTNSKGKATFNLKKLTKKGKYTAVIKFAGNGNYKSATKKVKITIK
jgi:parallel beta-helix repeat protein